MSSRRQSRLIRLAGGLVAFFLVSSPAPGHWPRPGEPSQAERALIARGFELDTASLLELVGAGTDLEARLDALDVLSSRPEDEVRGPLLELLQSEPHPLVHRELAITLARFGEHSAVEILRVLMRQATRDGERAYLAATLVRLGELEGYSLLIATLDSQSSTARDRARGALFYLAFFDLVLEPPLDAAWLLLEGLEDAEPWNRQRALNLVGEGVNRGLEAELFFAAVERMAAEDPAPEVRERAALILRRLESSMNDELQAELQPRLELLRKLAKERLRKKLEDPPPP